MTRRGLSALEAIRSATTSAADPMGWADDFGSLDFGEFADLIAVQGDPTADITVLERVEL